MLADHCPRCSTPLMRSKEDKIYCVSCKLYAVYESEAGGEPLPASATEVPVAVPRPLVHPVDTSVPTSSMVRGDQSAAQSVFGEEVEGSVRSAALGVAARMAESSQALARSSPREAIHLLEEIQACASALREMRAALV